jgi:hypothetical protein
VEVKDARLRDQCTMECEFCDCTRSIKLPGNLLSNDLDIPNENLDNCDDAFLDIGRLKLNRGKQQEGLESLKKLLQNSNSSIKPLFAGAAISGLFAIFRDDSDYFRIKNIPDNEEARNLLEGIGLHVYGDISSTKQTARNSLAKSARRSNVV